MPDLPALTGVEIDGLDDEGLAELHAALHDADPEMFDGKILDTDQGNENVAPEAEAERAIVLDDDAA